MYEILHESLNDHYPRTTHDPPACDLLKIHGFQPVSGQKASLDIPSPPPPPKTYAPCTRTRAACALTCQAWVWSEGHFGALPGSDHGLAARPSFIASSARERDAVIEGCLNVRFITCFHEKYAVWPVSLEYLLQNTTKKAEDAYAT